MPTKHSFGLILILLALLFGFTSTYTVTQGQEAIKLFLGKPVTDAQSQPMIYGPGLHLKWPLLNSVHIFDTRLQTLSVDSSPIFTKNQNQVLVDYYVKWRIVNILQYYKSTQGLQRRAGDLLTKNINSDLNQAFGQKEINDVIGERDQTAQMIMAQVKEAATDFGLQVVDVRIKAIDLPTDVYNSVFDRMRSQREQEAKKIRSQGKQQAEKMKADADAAATMLLAKTNEEAAILRANGNPCTAPIIAPASTEDSNGSSVPAACVRGGEKRAAEVYANAYKEDPQFYKFYKSLQAYKSAFANKQDVIVVQPNSDFFTYFNKEKGQAGDANN